ncbi:hypothetical protein NUBL17187_33810 [Klebsiella michiganensis]|nr:hypothetical protein NUBL17187_33810 [Klebsiella michiganensis]
MAESTRLNAAGALIAVAARLKTLFAKLQAGRQLIHGHQYASMELNSAQLF